MRPSDTPGREQRLRWLFGQPIDRDGIELAPTDAPVEVSLDSLDHIVGLQIDDLTRLMN